MQKKTKAKIKITFIIVVLILIIYGILKSMNYSLPLDNEKIKKVLEENDTKFIKITNSSDHDYRKDIYVDFRFPAGSEGDNYKYYYRTVIIRLMNTIGDEKIRLIDEKKNMIIQIQKDKKAKKIYFLVNNDPDYFEKGSSIEYLKNMEPEKKIDLEIKSPELQRLVANNWNRGSSKLGKITSSKGNFDVYGNSGFRVFMLGNKVLSIIFEKDYAGEVFKGITTGHSNEEIYKKFNEFHFATNEGLAYIGYKTNDVNIVFTHGEIYVFSKESLESSELFSEKLDEFFKNMNLNEFVNEIKKIYPNFIIIEEKKDKLDLIFPIQGFRILYDNKKVSIIIFDNFRGKIINGYTKEELIKNSTLFKKEISLVETNSFIETVVIFKETYGDS